MFRISCFSRWTSWRTCASAAGQTKHCRRAAIDKACELWRLASLIAGRSPGEVVDALFVWQDWWIHWRTGAAPEMSHCQRAYVSELMRMQYPPNTDRLLPELVDVLVCP
jgi:hypothetical protein